MVVHAIGTQHLVPNRRCAVFEYSGRADARNVGGFMSNNRFENPPPAPSVVQHNEPPSVAQKIFGSNPPVYGPLAGETIEDVATCKSNMPYATLLAMSNLVLRHRATWKKSTLHFERENEGERAYLTEKKRFASANRPF